ncbi:hypothetical protein N180_20710 [Pedobacter antarcticus 4BY]|uniref:Plasmid transfer protein n=2 Tax=Pedobacter antarcticus TaxID=34086 RepID=A0A081PHE6_9SPHI|nr:hypothetical protein [Pedobacter antarcticus]KEQ30119.1 hypothetical protein N180_20710 [Pedobacter antarcticus 4BY]SFF48578.1 hypothetical protein SAMN03003324_04151 [Pedobacter antarcticus]
MKILIFMMTCLCLAFSASAQVYTDPAVSAAILSSSSQHNNNLNKTNDQLTLIQRGQMAITSELAVANGIQRDIYTGLTEISGAVKTVMGVQRAADYVTKIFDNVRKSIEVAQGNPALLLFAEKNARDFRKRSLELSTYVTEFALKGGKANLMDAGERAKIMRYIINELILLNGISYGMHRSMYYAKQNGIFRSLNPWQTWVNRDAQIARETVRDFQYINK